MTIAQAFNEIAIAHGGTANNSGTITGAIDALNDALAGSDQAAAETIEDAVRMLGEHIGSGGGGGGVDVGELQGLYCLANAPAVNDLLSSFEWASVYSIKIGGTEICGDIAGNYSGPIYVASGATVCMQQEIEQFSIITYDMSNGVVTNVDEAEVAVSTVDGMYEFVMPILNDENKALVIVVLR